MLRDPTNIHEAWKLRESATQTLASEWAAPATPLSLLLAPSILDLVAEEIEHADPAAKHAVGRHDVLTLLAIASGNPGGIEHNRARVALEAFVRDCGVATIREWARDNDAPTLIVGLRACAELLKEGKS